MSAPRSPLAPRRLASAPLVERGLTTATPLPNIDPMTSVTADRLEAAARAPRGFGLLLRLLAANWTFGRLTVRLPGGASHLLEGSRPGPAATLEIRDYRFAGRVLASGDIGFAEGYMAGEWETPHLAGLLEALARNGDQIRRLMVGNTLMKGVHWLTHRMNRNSRSGSRKNIHAHYDIGNDFYELMLDETMAYSCAIFERPDQSLADAQRAKFDRLCQRLRLSPGDHLLEIGTGWGGLALHAASTYGCRVTTTTISDAQHDAAAKRVAEAGLADRITVLDADYRDLTGTYDKLVSVEMIEAVDWRDHDRFFSACAGLLRPGGLAALQAIVIADRSYERAKRHDDFIRSSIFPGGCLPSVTSLTTAAGRAGLRLIELEDIGIHYAETLRRWRATVETHAADVADLGLDERFRRLWDLYLTYCEAAFRERHVSDVQVLLAR